MDPGRFFQAEIEQHAALLEAVRVTLAAPFTRLVRLAAETVAGGGKLLFFGNGGSAADAQHLAAELTGRYARDRAPIAALALTTDSSALTAIGNDYGFEALFERQLRALGRPGDLAIGISTSGRSPNVVRGLRAARELGLSAAAFAGNDGGLLQEVADPLLIVPSASTARIQEMHILLGHMLCAALERELGLVTA